MGQTPRLGRDFPAHGPDTLCSEVTGNKVGFVKDPERLQNTKVPGPARPPDSWGWPLTPARLALSPA